MKKLVLSTLAMALFISTAVAQTPAKAPTKGKTNATAPKVKLKANKPASVPAATVPTAKVEAPKVETPQANVPQAEAPKASTPQVEAPQPNVSKMEAPKADMPQAEAPQPNISKMEAPKVGTPQVEAPQPNISKMEAPKVGTPNVGVPAMNPMGDLGALGKNIATELGTKLLLNQIQSTKVGQLISTFLTAKSAILPLLKTDPTGFASKLSGAQGDLMDGLKTVLSPQQMTNFMGMKPKTNDATNVLSSLFF
jgi:hypothetical protein